MVQLLLAFACGVAAGVLGLLVIARDFQRRESKKAALQLRQAQQEVFNRAMAELQNEDPAWRDKLQ